MTKRNVEPGTRKSVAVLQAVLGRLVSVIVVQADDDAIGEVHRLITGPRGFPGRPEAGDRGTITWTGGQWRYEPLDSGAAAVNAAVAGTAEAVASGTWSC